MYLKQDDLSRKLDFAATLMAFQNINLYDVPETAITLIRADTDEARAALRDGRLTTKPITLHEREYLQCEKAAGQ